MERGGLSSPVATMKDLTTVVDIQMDENSAGNDACTDEESGGEEEERDAEDANDDMDAVLASMVYDRVTAIAVALNNGSHGDSRELGLPNHRRGVNQQQHETTQIGTRPTGSIN